MSENTSGSWSSPGSGQPPAAEPNGGPAAPVGAPTGDTQAYPRAGQAHPQADQPYPQAGAQQPYAPHGQPAHGQQPYGQPAAPYGQQPGWGQPQPRPSNGLAIAALVVGVVALLVCAVPLVNVVGLVGGIAAVVLGVLGLRKAKAGASGRGLSVAGIVVGAVAAVVSAVVLALTAMLTTWAESELRDLDRQLEEEVRQLEEDLGSTTGGEGSGSDALLDDLGDLGDLDLGEGDFGLDVAMNPVAFGETFEYADGLTVTVSEPEPFTPSESAFIIEEWAEYLVFEVTVVNGTGADYEPFLWSTLQAGGEEAEEVFDAEAGIMGPPMETIAAGGTVTFPVVYGVNDASSLQLDYVVGLTYEGVSFQR